MGAILRMRTLVSPTVSTFSNHLQKPTSVRFYVSPSQSLVCNSPTLQNPNLFPKSSMVSFRAFKPTRFAQNRGLQLESSLPSSSGEIHVIVGPMFAGKTTTLLRRVQHESDHGSFQAESPRNFRHLDKTLKGLCLSGRLAEAVKLLCCTGLQVSSETYALLLQESIHRKEFMIGKRIHGHLVTVGFVPGDYLETKLLILHAKSGNLGSALCLFNRLPAKSLISWNVMISGYVQKGFYEVGFELYCSMVQGGMAPDQFTFASVFRACASMATLGQGKQAHGLMIKCPIRDNIIVNSSLMDMYFKCSSPVDGHQVFDISPNKNVVTWTSLISGYGQLGRVEEVLELFNRMRNEGFLPNYVTFLAVLCACSHGGLVKEGRAYFTSMINDYGIRPTGKHFAAIVDLLGRAGNVQEAYEFVQRSPCGKHSVIWSALLGASRLHGNIDLVKLAANKYIELEPENPDKYVLLSHTYAAFGMWNSVADVWKAMKESGMKKVPAYSRIEVQGEVHFFFMGDKSHKLSEQIFKTIKHITCMLKDADYVPDLGTE